MEVAARQKSVERVLASCEALVSDNTQFKGKEWKLSQYVIALRKQVTELNKYSSVDRDKMAMFLQKLAVLEGIVTTSPTEGVCDVPNPVKDKDSNDGSNEGVSSRTKRLQKERKDRAELFGQATGLRHRGSAGNGSEGSHEVVIERQRRNQEAIADEMMGLARSLKENAIAAKDIITRDNKALKTTNEKAEKNISDVDTQTGRIKQHSRGCPWGTMLLMIVIFVIFISMVILIRIVPKPR